MVQHCCPTASQLHPMLAPPEVRSTAWLNLQPKLTKAVYTRVNFPKNTGWHGGSTREKQFS